MKAIILKAGVILLLIFTGTLSYASDYPKSIQKKINKATKAVFSSTDVEFEKLDVSIDLTEFPQIKEVKVDALKLNQETVGYAGFASSKGKNDYFDYMVLFDNDMVIQKVVMLFYRSSYGGEIMARYWLKQFIGKSNGESMEYEKDIDSISGATISAPAMTDGVKALSVLMKSLKNKGEL
jgi:Na+-translocating ferredoxin:NAD+ oxidoreductase RnfG subunit